MVRAPAKFVLVLLLVLAISTIVVFFYQRKYLPPQLQARWRILLKNERG
jgi:hypothetical protein